jgi:hypothetical protein
MTVIQPYWIEDDALAYVQSVRQSLRDGNYISDRALSDIKRKLNSNILVWLQAIVGLSYGGNLF